MSHQVKIKVRPQQRVRFPGVCVHCVQPAVGRMGVKKRIGRLTRYIDLPLCADCERMLRRRSGEEERRQRVGWLVSGLLFFLLLALVLLLTPATLDFVARLFIALTLSLGMAAAVLALFRRSSFRAALPAKKAIYHSAKLTHFSWRATTFVFENETFAERFRMLNQALLME